MKKSTFKLLLICLCLTLPTLTLKAAEWSLERTDTGYNVNIDGKLFAGYRTDAKRTPIIWPIIGPTGQEMTRSFPMNPEGKPAEKKDHPHHQSFWFTHGDVNGEDYWTLKASIKHKQFVKAEKDANGVVLVTENDWLDKDGKVLCTDLRTIRFGLHGENRLIDFDVTVTAVADPVVFGDTKEGSFAVRVPGRLDGDGRRLDKTGPAGTIVNAEGLKGDATWGKQSSWVDYFGELENGDVVGIAILNHPKSFRYPTYWHVRTYGLFAANPFGINDFVKEASPGAGALTLKKGESFTLRYRVVFHKGTSESIDLPKMFEEYSKLP
jgi:hypothetical protein